MDFNYNIVELVAFCACILFCYVFLGFHTSKKTESLYTYM